MIHPAKKATATLLSYRKKKTHYTLLYIHFQEVKKEEEEANRAPCDATP